MPSPDPLRSVRSLLEQLEQEVHGLGLAVDQRSRALEAVAYACNVVSEVYSHNRAANA